MRWRVTFLEQGTSILDVFPSLSEGRTITTPPNATNIPRVELRGTNGELVRIGQGGEFTLLESPFGEIPQFYGEVYVSRKNPGKYRTSCYIGSLPALKLVDYFVKSVEGENSDEYMALLGDIVVFEFDREGRQYNIITISEGKKARVAYSEGDTTTYIAGETSDITDEDYDYILKNYIDPRNWR